MAVVNQILHRKNSSGSYDTVYLKANLANVIGVLAPENGGTGASEFTPYVHPATKQCNYSYTHPTSKQCDYSYTHPSAKQCDAVIPDVNNYYTKTEVDALIRQSERRDWAIGKIVTWDNKEWLICHLDYSKGYYLIAKDIISTSQFSYSSTTYAGSTLAQTAMNYQTNNMTAAALAECVNITVNGVTAKVFVPSREQMAFEDYPNQGFSWFNSNERRKASLGGSGATDYWTSSASSNSEWTVFVDSTGGFNDYRPKDARGFRPCICVQL